MNNGIFIIAHAPLASALRQCVLHVFPDASPIVAVLDVVPTMSTKDSLAAAAVAMSQLNTEGTLVLTDILGATPSNVAHKLAIGSNARLIAGVNLPMLLRAVTYRHESLDTMVERATSGGTQGVVQVSVPSYHDPI